ncbi:MAG: CDP-alcohol phosphatidyltransferase family protein [Candidatus Omnitrophica bacterium]|nr:CDP-alcohol phosphatidyltransferase family protein [Candidatus Omnitrophota bacterium]
MPSAETGEIRLPAVKKWRPNRLLSRPLTRLFLKTPLTPNHITLMSLGFGLTAGLLFSRGYYLSSLAGAFCYQLAIVLDNCDGEIARAKNLSSALGGRLDVTADFLTDLALFTGIFLGALKGPFHRFAPLLFMLCLSGAAAHFVLVVMEKRRDFGPAVFHRSNPNPAGRQSPLFQLFDSLREGEASWFVLVFAVLGHTSYLLWFGAVYIQFLWIGAFFLNFKWLAGGKMP